MRNLKQSSSSFERYAHCLLAPLHGPQNQHGSGKQLTIRQDLLDIRPRDKIDVQSFIWVQGSDEYDE